MDFQFVKQDSHLYYSEASDYMTINERMLVKVNKGKKYGSDGFGEIESTIVVSGSNLFKKPG